MPKRKSEPKEAFLVVFEFTDAAGWPLEGFRTIGEFVSQESFVLYWTNMGKNKTERAIEMGCSREVAEELRARGKSREQLQEDRLTRAALQRAAA